MSDDDFNQIIIAAKKNSAVKMEVYPDFAAADISLFDNDEMKVYRTICDCIRFGCDLEKLNRLRISAQECMDHYNKQNYKKTENEGD